MARTSKLFIDCTLFMPLKNLICGCKRIFNIHSKLRNIPIFYFKMNSRESGIAAFQALLINKSFCGFFKLFLTFPHL